MYECKICNKQFEKKYSYLGHCSSHNRGEKYKVGRKKTKPKNAKTEIEYSETEKNKASYLCRYCKIQFDSGLKLGGHQTWCHKNPNKNISKKKVSLSFKGKTLSEEHKKKISDSRKKYLDDNPGKIPYLLNHSSKESYPEKIFREALERRKIEGWTYNFSLKRYSLDFAFTRQLIDVEIDGNTHLLENVRTKDLVRDEYLKQNGWKVIRFTASRIKLEVDQCVNELLFVLNQ